MPFWVSRPSLLGHRSPVEASFKAHRPQIAVKNHGAEVNNLIQKTILSWETQLLGSKGQIGRKVDLQVGVRSPER